MPRKKSTIPVADMPVAAQRQDAAQRQREYRASKRAAIAEGAAMPNETITRDLLADIAIMILATDSPGSELIMSALGRYFVGKEGWPISIQAKAKTGRLKPKILK